VEGFQPPRDKSIRYPELADLKIQTQKKVRPGSEEK
jgi:hypothetical protein